MRNSEEDINNLLKSIYRIAAELVYSIYFVDKDFASKVGKSLDKYEFGFLIEAFQNSADNVSKLVLFFEDYIEGIVKGLEFFSSLVFALGIKEYSEIISQENKLEEFIQLDMIDLDFLKFQMRNTEELIYPQVERLAAKTIENLERIRKVSAILKSDTLNTFIEEFEKQKSNWDKIRKRISHCFSIVEKEADISTCVNQISELINEFVVFAVDIRNLTSHIEQITGNKLELSIDNVTQIAETIKQLSRDLIILVKCRATEAEHVSSSFFQILTMLWGSEEKAHKKFQSVIRSEISLDDLIPQSFSPQNLGFGVVQARNQILLADRAHRRVKENIEAMRIAAEYLNSPVLGEQYEIIVKEIEIIDKYWPEHTKKVRKLQQLLLEKSNIKI